MPAGERQAIADDAPSRAEMTDYDRAHVSTYLRLLDAVTEGAPWEEVARVLLAVEAATILTGRGGDMIATWNGPWIASRGYWELFRKPMTR